MTYSKANWDKYIASINTHPMMQGKSEDDNYNEIIQIVKLSDITDAIYFSVGYNPDWFYAEVKALGGKKLINVLKNNPEQLMSMLISMD